MRVGDVYKTIRTRPSHLTYMRFHTLSRVRIESIGDYFSATLIFFLTFPVLKASSVIEASMLSKFLNRLGLRIVGDRPIGRDVLARPNLSRAALIRGCFNSNRARSDINVICSQCEQLYL